MTEEELQQKLAKIERLHAGASTPGEKHSAADAHGRILQRLQQLQRQEKAIEYKFTLTDSWSRRLFIALLRRYDLQPYRRARQRRNTILVRVPESFVDKTLWPEFLELSAQLQTYLDEVTTRVIRTAFEDDGSSDFLPELPEF